MTMGAMRVKAPRRARPHCRRAGQRLQREDHGDADAAFQLPGLARRQRVEMAGRQPRRTLAGNTTPTTASHPAPLLNCRKE